MDISALQLVRLSYQPKLPPLFDAGTSGIIPQTGEPTESIADQSALKERFSRTYGTPVVEFKKGKAVHDVTRPLTIGVILSGGQAPGGHNVITGLFDGLIKTNPESKLIGFLGGPAGLTKDKSLILDATTIDRYRNTGGFDMINSGRDKIETPEQFAQALETAKKHKLDAVIIIGGDDSNTNAALLAEYFISSNATTQVIGVPKTIDGDLKNEYIETSFGFDTACKTYSELIGNIARDANSAQKYWHFIKLMGRAASHIALECALQTHPNVCLVSEEIEAKQFSLAQVVDTVVDSIVKRAAKGLNFGIVLVPEGLVEFIPEVKKLISELNDLIAQEEKTIANLSGGFPAHAAFIRERLPQASATTFDALPPSIQAELLLDRDPHGNVQVSLIDTEKLLIQLVRTRLSALKKSGEYIGKFSALPHFFGYEGRCAFPSNFDADYCYALGRTAFLLVANGYTGYLSSVRNLASPTSDWVIGGIPLTMLMNMEQRHGSQKPVIRKALTELDGEPFKAYAAVRSRWAVETDFVFPGAIQYFGPPEVCDQPTITLTLETNSRQKTK